MATIQEQIHHLEHQGEHKGAAQLAVDNKFYQVSRALGLLVRLPLGLDGQAALIQTLTFSWDQSRPLPVLRKRKEYERACGQHYLVHHAPDSDKVYVTVHTLDAYRSLGGKPYPGLDPAVYDWGVRRSAVCIICGDPAAYLGADLCEFCYQVTQRLPKFMASDKGRDHIIRLIGRAGLHEIAVVLQGEEDARNSDSREDKGGVDDEEER